MNDYKDWEISNKLQDYLVKNRDEILTCIRKLILAKLDTATLEELLDMEDEIFFAKNIIDYEIKNIYLRRQENKEDDEEEI